MNITQRFQSQAADLYDTGYNKVNRIIIKIYRGHNLNAQSAYAKLAKINLNNI